MSKTAYDVQPARSIQTKWRWTTALNPRIRLHNGMGDGTEPIIAYRLGLYEEVSVAHRARGIRLRRRYWYLFVLFFNAFLTEMGYLVDVWAAWSRTIVLRRTENHATQQHKLKNNLAINFNFFRCFVNYITVGYRRELYWKGRSCRFFSTIAVNQLETWGVCTTAGQSRKTSRTEEEFCLKCFLRLQCLLLSFWTSLSCFIHN